jgi:hypothetical protein
MAIDPMQVSAMQQASTGGLGVGMPGAYGAAPQAFGGLFQPQGFFNLLGQLVQPPGGAISSILGNVPVGGQISGFRPWPFGVNPLVAAYGGQLAPQSFFWQPPGGALGGVSPLQAVPGTVPVQGTPNVELEAVNSFMKEATSNLIRKLHDYLDKNSQQYSQLADCAQLVRQAVEAYGAGDYARSFTQLYQAYRFITMVRSGRPEIPSL